MVNSVKTTIRQVRMTSVAIVQAYHTRNVPAADQWMIGRGRGVACATIGSNGTTRCQKGQRILARAKLSAPDAAPGTTADIPPHPGRARDRVVHTFLKHGYVLRGSNRTPSAVLFGASEWKCTIAEDHVGRPGYGVNVQVIAILRVYKRIGPVMS